MMRKILLISLAILINACSASSHYRSEGPCKGFHKDQPACERAAANSSVIGKVTLGQSLKEVRQIMGKDPEHREVSKQSEKWEFITNYMDKRFTSITFKNGVVIGIK